ncbi:aminopeptidase N [Pseudonocardia sp. KRD-184]|uniref:Aminopeptidase N n=1 Tax=Pseudonocardia oceani TaxID=2792013 RepID=A0ABS6U6A8_9PSEU|nr:aminopeptidase N [Pseudonocardia oceani]MBW0091361.1 aminopeptidase N [Pseudonocardia oceani]MBW0098275.1 aminopeptidase N [Pseudonocardia oceani]MBW0124837.1 aminopeptidase N [Pseudonocardia oceani]MBW0127439.1 aminopeptidase N [Pseudonocardia oceani]
MAPPNLTRSDAERRAALLDVADYTVAIDLTDGGGEPGEDTFSTVTTVRFSCTQPGSDSWIDLVAAEVSSAVLNGQALDVSGYREEDGIALPGLAAENELRVEALGRYMHTGEGLHRFVDPVDGSVYLYSQFETADAKRMFACFDQPDLKARYTLTITAPADWQVVVNSVVEETSEGAGGAVVHRFTTSEIMSTYLVALVAGPYAVWRDEHRDEDGGVIPLGIFCRASLAPHMDHERLFTETKQGFDFYHRNFGVRYPFGKYDQLFVPEFNAGAMENAGAVTFLEDYVFRSRVTRPVYERRAETVLHEMAHMWFGDLVTMTWWDDLWLNESFATFASVLCQADATEYKEAWTTFANVEKSWAYRQDQLPSTHPVAADIPDLQAVEVNFDGITYAKGASVLKQLVAYVGLEPFLAGLRAYFTKHAWGNATFDDLLGALEESSGRDLSGWGAQWLRTTGLNMLRPSFDVDTTGAFARFEVVQGGARPGAGELRTHRIAVGVYDDDGSGALVRTHRVEVDVEGERTPVADLIGVPRGKLVLVNDDDLTYCALRLDPDSLVTLIDRIGDITEPLPRTLCWSAAWEMTREAELKARDLVALVAGGFGRETEIGVLQRLLLQAQTAVSSYADERWAAERGWPLLVDALLFRLDTSRAGSDTQLAVVNSLTSSVLHTSVLDGFAGWLVDVEVPEGLTVDTDLRWRLLHALVAHGAAGPERIEEELAADPTSTGRRQAERARSLVPTAAAKEEAWRRAVHDDTLPNAVTESIISGFAHPTQKALLAPYVERYFAEVADVWERRTSEHAQAVVIGLFPSWAVEQTTVDAADAWLADESHPPALRRLVTEGRAGIVRALGAREFDRS